MDSSSDIEDNNSENNIINIFKRAHTENNTEHNIADISDKTDIDPIPKKKRGRKPKKKTSSVPVKEKKKRGRKPKKNTYAIIKSDDTDKQKIEENIIMSLPITIKKNNSDTEDIPRKNIFLRNSIDKNIKNRRKWMSYLEEDDDFCNLGTYTSSLSISEIPDIEYLEQNDNHLASVHVNPHSDVQYIHKSLENFLTKDGKLPKKTEISCWWDTYQFDNVPCCIPEKIVDNIYVIDGVFCSFNCAIRYLMNESPPNVWIKCSLLKQLYRKVNNSNISYLYSINIQLAPLRRMLKKFGGTLTIEQFRSKFENMNNYFSIINPPIMIQKNIYIEEGTYKNENDGHKSNIPLKKDGEDLVIKRNKPLLHHEHNVVKKMGLKIIQN